MKQIENIALKAIKIVCIVLISVTLFYSLFSDILIKGYGSGIKIALFIIFLVWGSFLFIQFRKYKNLIFRVLPFIFWGTFIVMFTYQLLILHQLDASPKNDAETLLANISSPKMLSDYLSSNTNNQFYFFLNMGLSQIFGDSIYAFQLFNIFIINSSVLLLKKVSIILFGNQEISYLTALFYIWVVMFQPLFMVPYTDSYSLPLVLLSVLALMKIGSYKSVLINLDLCLLAGIIIGFTYLIRPSAIIFIIAFLVLRFLSARGNKYLTFVIVTLLIISGSSLVLKGFQNYVYSQKHVKIVSNKSVPYTHFLLLGSSGDENNDGLHGTWNAEDVQLTYSQPNSSKMKEVSWKAFVKRTQKRGLLRSIKFYLVKYRDTTDAGVIGYRRDGLWLSYKTKNLFYHIFSENGFWRPIFNVICQVIWVFLLFSTLIYLFKIKDFTGHFLALTFIGGMMFLILFESGGTKYILQYIPWYCLMAGPGAYKLFTQDIKLNSNIYKRLSNL